MTAKKLDYRGSTEPENTDSKRNQFQSDRSWMPEFAVFALLVASGVIVRLACRDLPNFAPVAAVALFAGYYFRSGVVALCVPMAVMAISDYFLGGYHWAVMATVYGALSLPVAFRGWLRRTFRLGQGSMSGTMASTAGLFSCGLLSSLMFFFVTNLGVWLWFGTYERGLAGLWHCYVAAIPFFRYTLTGDMIFTVALFGSYALATSVKSAREPAAQAA